MITEIKDYIPVSEFAKTFVRKNGLIGVSRNAIHLLIQKEIDYPGTTGLDVVIIGKHYYVRQSNKVTKKK
jgi:hypothetical protein